MTLAGLASAAAVLAQPGWVFAPPLTPAVLATPGPAPTPSDAASIAPGADAVLLRAKLKSPAPLIWVFTGDSITHGAKWLGRERSYPEIIQERIRWELGRMRDIVINSGISGENAAGLLADFEWRVLQFKPSVVSIMIGMNDCSSGQSGLARYEGAVREMIRRVRAAGAIPILNRTNPLLGGTRSQRGENLPAYNEVIARLAVSENVLLVDHWKHWAEAAPSPEKLRAWMADDIHPNAAGHRQFAIQWCKVAGIYSPAAPACRP